MQTTFDQLTESLEPASSVIFESNIAGDDTYCDYCYTKIDKNDRVYFSPLDPNFLFCSKCQAEINNQIED